MRKLKILYIGTLSSERLVSDMLKNKNGLPNLAAQKYHRLLAQGIAKNEDLFEIQVLSVPEFCKNKENINLFIIRPEIEHEVNYKYTPLLLIPILKYLIIFIHVFIQIIKFNNKKTKYKKVIIFDILNFNLALVTIISKLFLNTNIISIVTDLPEYMYILDDKISFKNKLIYKTKNFLLSFVDGFIFLTDEMNKKVNKKNKPYCVIEGIVDLDKNKTSKMNINKSKIIHYSGGLYEKFGVKALIDAFMKINDKDVELHIFGNGDLINYIKQCSKINSRIIFFGYQDNKYVIQDQLNSFVLVNPRFSHEIYTKYSFPSKTIEYMASGTPLLSTKLSSIPLEYNNYFFKFENEETDSYVKTLNEILSISKDEMIKFGFEAKCFVLKNKNKIKQAQLLYRNFLNI